MTLKRTFRIYKLFDKFPEGKFYYKFDPATSKHEAEFDTEQQCCDYTRLMNPDAVWLIIPHEELKEDV